MDKKKLVLILFSLLLFLAGAVFVSRTLLDQVPEFAVKNPEKIKKIIIKSNTNAVSLEKTEVGWMLNGIEEARMDAVDALIKTLTDLEVKSPIDKIALENMLLDGDIEEVSINVKSALKTLKNYQVYKVSTNPYGNIMTKGGKANYIMHVPGYPGDIGVFYTTRSNYWKPHVIFDYKLSDISSVEFINGIEPLNSFRINRTGSGVYVLEEFDSGRIVENADPGQITRYLSYFHSIGFEKFLDSDTVALTNSILEDPALYTISVKDINNKEKLIKVFPVYLGKDSEKVNNNYAYASISWENEIVLIKYFAIDPLLKGIDYFVR